MQQKLNSKANFMHWRLDKMETTRDHHHIGRFSVMVLLRNLRKFLQCNTLYNFI